MATLHSRSLRHRCHCVPVDDVAVSLAVDFLHLGITTEDEVYRWCAELWSTS